MNLGEKLHLLIDGYEETDKLKVFSTSSEDNHQKVNEYIWDADMVLVILKNSLKDFEKYGDCEGTDPKGNWIKNIDFELVK